MASGPITSWQIDGETMEAVTGFIILGSKITEDGHCSHEIKRRLLLGRNQPRQHIKKQRHYFANKGPSSQGYGFSSSHMYGCESWTIKKAEPQRIGAFEKWCWRRLLRIPWTARRSSQPILKEISPEYSLEGLLVKLKLQYFGHLKWRANSFDKTLCWERLKGGGEGDDRGWGDWMASPTQWTWIWVHSGNWWWTGRTGVLQSMGSQRVVHDWVTELNWTEL